MKFAIAVLLAVQSLSYSSGQNVSPAYEGWEVGTDGVTYLQHDRIFQLLEDAQLPCQVGLLLVEVEQGGW